MTTNNPTPRQAGQAAARAGLTQDDNPHLGPTGRAGLRWYVDEAAGSAWTVGFRDERDAMHVERHGRVLNLGDFVQRKSRRPRWAKR